MRYSNSHKLKVYPPRLSANLSSTKYPVLPLVLQKMMGWNINTQDWTLLWTDQSVSIDQVKSLTKNQRINHFPGMFELSRKNRLARNLNALRKQFPEEYSFYPQTWVLPLEYSQLQQFELENPGTIYIVKPEAGCQGRGIYLTDNIEQLQKLKGYIVQKYIQKPYLIDNLKFDFRIYVLITCVNPLRIYVFDQGLARFAVEGNSLSKIEFKPAGSCNLKKTFSHLTNYSLNKQHSNFVFSDDDFSVGHKRSLKSTLASINDPTLNQKIYDVIIKTLISGQPQLSSHYKSAQSHNINSCFEVLGFDIILDQNLNPHLLQINHTPSFNIDTNLDRKVKIDLIMTTIKMVCRQNDQLQQQLTSRKYKYDYLSSMLDYQLKQKDAHQMKNLGRFTRIYPVQDPQLKQKYDSFQKASNEIFHKKYGTNIVRRTKKVYDIQQQPIFVPKVNLHKDLEKVYRRNQLKPIKNMRINFVKKVTDESESDSRKRLNYFKQKAFQVYGNKTSIHNFRSASSNLGV